MMPTRVERALLRLSDAGEELFDWLDLGRPVDGRGLRSALLLAFGLVATGYAMDWFVFGAIRLTRPDFFACITGVALVPPVLTLGIRRLRTIRLRPRLGG